jgi:guanylate kinase
MPKGSLFIVSAPSGTGKTSLVKGLVDTLKNIKVSVSHTTREKRPGEINGVNYHFVTRDEFQNMIEQDDFLEHADVYGFFYGTSKHWVKEQLADGVDVILEIESQGAKQAIEQFPKAISIFILPPSQEALKTRLHNRAQDKPDVIEHRLSEAKNEVKHCSEYDYIIVNDQFETALSDIRSVVRADHVKHARQTVLLKPLIDDLMA